jgi:hypothetical protein
VLRSLVFGDAHSGYPRGRTKAQRTEVPAVASPGGSVRSSLGHRPRKSGIIDINSRKYTHAVNRKLAASGPHAPPDPRIAVSPPPAAARSRKMENPDRDILRKRKTTTAFARLY